MSGHSKWSTIKHKKAILDAKKGKIFSKVSTQITHAAKEGGGDPDMNPSLRMYVDKAKEVGFPQDKIEKAIQKGTGEGSEGVIYDDSTYEGFGPFGIQIMVDTLTDNKNRTVADLRNLFESIGGSMGEEGSVAWNFDLKGLIIIKCGHMEKAEKYGEDDKFVKDDTEEVMLNIMEIEGVLDIQEVDLDGTPGLEIYTDYRDWVKVRDEINKLGYVVKEAGIIKEAKTFKNLGGKELEKAQEALEKIEDNDDVQEVWSNLKEI
ncbi:MAG: putative transcriptional regulatory protein [candidate division WS6 bacterium 36_33]|uniref:Probable transcriptional regulatory protein XD87_0224 n=1 Tax=candidate division WS6 bacterium 36_33 TaxID=1641388 RepID=A0A101GYZ3_9BACT|nr:MAG: putative transcriptional regulatory protein [candidate division WS6 bacterium 36_33]